MPLGEIITKIRISQSMTQKDLAEATGLAQCSISQIENNNRNPSLHVFQAMAKALRMPGSKLLQLVERDEREWTLNEELKSIRKQPKS